MDSAATGAGATETLPIAVAPTENPTGEDQLAQVLEHPGFGSHFTDHMFKVTWSADTGWHSAGVVPYGPVSMDPASACLHYAQEVFEGLKAYRHADQTVWTFRPEANGARMRGSARRLALPELPTADFVAAVDSLVATDQRWVPDGEGERSLYLRPFMFASEVFLGVRPAKQVTFMVIASPAGAYFTGGLKPVSIWLSEELSRAGVGGTGAAKTGGNYASSLLAQREAAAAGCEQVVFLDTVERRWVEELGGMNLFFCFDDGSVVTPELSGSILPGITRDSVLTLCDSLGYKAIERRVSVEEWREGVASGRITEVFACGTAAVVNPVGTVRWQGGEMDCTRSTGGDVGPVTSEIRQALVDLQYGRRADDFGWMHRVA